MKLSNDLSLRQNQTLTLTPELIQAIQLLQYNALELEEYIEKQLEANPVLESGTAPEAESPPHGNSAACETGAEAYVPPEENEEIRAPQPRADKEFDWAEYLDAREIDDISYRHLEFSGYDKGEHGSVPEPGMVQDVTLCEHLTLQLEMAGLPENRLLIGRYIINSLDENGYLALRTEEIAAELGVEVHAVAETLHIVQSFDPPGVAAASLSECLLLQLESFGTVGDEIRMIIMKHLEDLAANRIGQIARAVKMDMGEVQKIADMIRTLEPKPGRQFARDSEIRYIFPDIIVEKGKTGYIVTLNEAGVPKLHISPYYRKLLRESEAGSGLQEFLTGRLNSAVWLIKSIEQRNQTLYNVVQAIVDHQIDFFEKGEKFLRPLTLKKIAEVVGVHESTVSRSVNGKYMQTPRGVFEIKRFFSSGISDGSVEGMAAGSIKAMIRDAVLAENPTDPLSDQAIVESLQEKGIDVSRRTIAKYRGAMGIKSSSGRRRY
ncbi:MAG: RNA polymerase factor sigma-54 [Clostridiales Family XIII bacterium]|jgi:RNA polymerase sigma-54 factor|nr:RNA polymerase factor sigma-54 [Clostridiales Family XIII bacterium]